MARWSVMRYVVLAGALGLLLLLWQGDRSSHDWMQPVQPSDVDPLPGPAGAADLALLERQLSWTLAEILSRVDGAGQVHVQVTLVAGPRTLYERDQQSSLRITEEEDAQGGVRSVAEETKSDTVVLGRSASGDRPIVSQVTSVQVRGVLVVAQGASSPQVEGRLVAAVAALLDVPLHRIQVIPGR